MKLIEADGKRILQEAGIVCPPSVFFGVDQALSGFESIRFPLYLKAQVNQGRRGQRGLVRRIASFDELPEALQLMRGLVAEIPCAGFLFESEIAHTIEWLVALDVDGVSGCIRVSFAQQGGMHVSEIQSRLIGGAGDIRELDVPQAVREVFKKMLEAFYAHDLISLEINPLVLNSDGAYMALDAKIELDDAASYRHPEWSSFRIPCAKNISVREDAYAKLLERAGHRGTFGRYVELEGDIAMILSGGGASLVAMDALRSAGGRAANYVEMSGNPDPETVHEAAKIVLSKPGIRAIWIAGSFANFTDIRATINATLQSTAELGLRVPIVIRRDGPNAEAARFDALAWGGAHHCDVRFDLADVDLDTSAQAVVAAARA